jgi:hypothetical protein
MSILIEKKTNFIKQGIKGKTGQFGPTSRLLRFCLRMRSRTSIMSRTGMPSVMQITRSRSASTASQIAAAANGGGT